jgi:quinol monooxygenase YgiN
MATELTVSGWLTIPAAEQEHLLPLLAEHTRLTHAEPGCLAFSVTRSPDDPERFDLAERFRDRDAFEAHRDRTAASPWGMATRHIPRNLHIAESGQ